VTTFAGKTTASPYHADGTGTNAMFYKVIDIKSIGIDFFVSSSYNNFLRKVTFPGAVVSSLYGVSGAVGGTDGVVGASGPGTHCAGRWTLSPDGTFYIIVCTAYKNIRKYTIATNIVTTIAGSPGTAAGSGCINSNLLATPVDASSRFIYPFSAVMTDNTNALILDRSTTAIRRVDVTTTLVYPWLGNCASTGSLNTAGTGTSANFNFLDMTLLADKKIIYAITATYLWKIDVAAVQATMVASSPFSPSQVWSKLSVFNVPDQCMACDPGKYCPLGSTVASVCPVGFYCSNPSVKLPCTVGNVCVAGTVTPTPCALKNYCPEGSSAESLCPAGSYCPTVSTKITCPAGTFCEAGSTSASLCMTSGTAYK
jgi:hypothetical protein